MAAAAEQDNRVKIPNGTAAVCAETIQNGENRSLEEILGRPLERRGRQATPSAGASQKTYGNGILHPPRVYGGCDLSQKTGCGTRYGCRSILFLGGKTMKLRKILAFVLTLVLAFSLVACAQTAADDTKAAALCQIKVTIVHADGSEKVLEYTTDEQYLGALLQAEGLIKGNDGPYGMEITEVDGEKAVYAEDKAYWALYEGTEYALQGIDTTPIVDGGEYKLEYTPA